MAIKKKPAPKKAAKKTTKKTAKKVIKKVVKRATKKVVPKVKRPYNRKPKADNVAVQVTGQDTKPDLLDLMMAEAQQQADQAESAEITVQQLDAIDLRLSPVYERFAVLMLLNSMGYIGTNLKPLVESQSNLFDLLYADALILQHNNKIVIPSTWDTLPETTETSTVHAQVKGDVTFDKPRQSYPQEYFIGKARYLRVE